MSKHKRLYLALSALMAAALTLGACGSTGQGRFAQAQPQNLLGVYTTVITFNDTYPYLDNYRDFYGTWQLKFEDEQHYTTILNSQPVVTGEYRLDPDEIQFLDKAGPYACLPENREFTGLYAWESAPDGIKLAAVADECAWHNLVLTGHPLTFAGESNQF